MNKKRVGFYYVMSLLAAIVVGGCATAPQNAQEPKLIEKTTFTGTALNLWYFYSVQMDCTPDDLPAVSVTRAASHGSVKIRSVDHFTEYPSTNPRSECNKKKSPSVVVVYTSEKSFVGVDRIEVKCLYSSGRVVTREFAITVEQPPPP
jgi:hypothetical protein